MLQDTSICPLPSKQVAREAALALPATPACTLQHKQLRRGAQGWPRGSASTRRGSRPHSGAAGGREGRQAAQRAKKGTRNEQPALLCRACEARQGEQVRPAWGETAAGRHAGSKAAPALCPRWAALLPAVNTASPDNPQHWCTVPPALQWGCKLNC